MIVFVLPVIFSIVFGSAVMADTLQKPDRELNMWPMTFSGESSHGKSSHGSGIEIIGLFLRLIITNNFSNNFY